MSWNFKGLSVADISDCGINFMYLPFDAETEQPKFKECARHPKVDEEGFVLYYTDQCPFTYYWVPRVVKSGKRTKGLKFKIAADVLRDNASAAFLFMKILPE